MRLALYALMLLSTAVTGMAWAQSAAARFPCSLAAAVPYIIRTDRR